MQYRFILTIITAVFVSVGSSAVLKHQPMTADKLIKDLSEIRDDIAGCSKYGADWNNWNGIQVMSFRGQAQKTNEKIKSSTKDLGELAPLSPEESKKALDVFGQVRDEETKFMQMAINSQPMHNGIYNGAIQAGLTTIKERISNFCVGFGDHITDVLKETMKAECEEMIKATDDAKAYFN